MKRIHMLLLSATCAASTACSALFGLHDATLASPGGDAGSPEAAALPSSIDAAAGALQPRPGPAYPKHVLPPASAAAGFDAGKAGTLAPARIRASQICRVNEVCVVGDVNGDGKADVIVFTHAEKPTVWVALSTDGSFASPVVWSNYFCMPTETCVVGDVDGDGAVDLVSFTRGTQNQVWVALSNGASGFGAAQKWSEFFCLDGELCSLADVNGDRRADVVVFTHAPQASAFVGLSTGSSFTGAQVWSESFCDPHATCGVADMDGDGRADAVQLAQGQSREVSVALSSGLQFSAKRSWGQACGDGQTCKLADVDGDSRADLVAFGGAAFPQVWVSRSLGDGLAPAEMWSDLFCVGSSCSAGDPYVLADVDGDHRADAVTFARSPPDVLVALSQEGVRPLFHGGPLLQGTPDVHLLWYGKWGDATASSLLPALVSALAGSRYLGIDATYRASPGADAQAATSAKLGASVFLGSPRGDVLSDRDVREILSDAAHLGTIPDDPGAIYVFLASSEVSESSGLCDTYCAYHSFVEEPPGTLKYAFIGDPGRCPTACAPQLSGPGPNGDLTADALANLLVHEILSVATNPELSAWYAPGGAEGPDLCNFVFGGLDRAPNGSASNVTFGSRAYLVQQTWVQGDPGRCALTVGP